MIGKFAASKAGHDKGQLYVIVGQEEDCLYLCDGRLKTLVKPKKKKVKHVQLTNKTVEQSLLRKLERKERVLDEEIKYAIKQYNRI